METTLIKVLLIEADEENYLQIGKLLTEARRARFELVWIQTYQTALAAMQDHLYDVYLIDSGLGDRGLGEKDGLELIRQGCQQGCSVPMICLGAQEDYLLEVEALQAGAADYLLKGELTTPLLERVIQYAIAQKRMETTLKQSQESQVQECAVALSQINTQLSAEIAISEAARKERQQAQESLDQKTTALEHQTIVLQSIINSMGDGVMVVGPDLYFLNPAAEQIIGVSQGQGSEGHWSEEYGLFLPDKVTRYSPQQLPMARAMQGEAMDGLEVFMRHPSAPEGVWMSMTARPLQGEMNLQGGVVVFHDITKLKQAEEDIQKALLREKELNELKSRFISMVSHEFRTPLSTILLYVELLQHYGQNWDAAKKEQQFQRIQEAIKTMTRLLEDVLTIGKADAEKLSLNPVPLNLEEFCGELIAEAHLTTKEQVQIELIQESQSSIVYLDQKLVNQILTNLISNAIKYSPNGGKITLTLSCQSETIQFQVQDQGIGIPAKDQQHLFEAFYRATNVGTISGTGLGLAIVKKCVDLHNGTITVNSEEGKGTLFTVVLPLRKDNCSIAVH
ncbi:MAG: ATP-binding protein [Leptolyngbyaceae bacterium]|nr:ATP-binding protein [Leptolyngbyaceae bacterium]